MLKCPVYKCFKEMSNEQMLIKHYDESHKDLKELGLELTPQNNALNNNINSLNGSGVNGNMIQIGGMGQSGEKGNNLKGKISNQFLN